LITKAQRDWIHLCHSNIRDGKLQNVAVESSMDGAGRRNGSMSDNLKFPPTKNPSNLKYNDVRVTTCVACTCLGFHVRMICEMVEPSVGYYKLIATQESILIAHL